MWKKTYSIALFIVFLFLVACVTPKEKSFVDIDIGLTQLFLASSILKPDASQREMLLYSIASGYNPHIHSEDTLLKAEMKSIQANSKVTDDIIRKGRWDDTSDYALYGLVARCKVFTFNGHPWTDEWMRQGKAFAKLYQGTNVFTKALLSSNTQNAFDFSSISNEISQLALSMTLGKLVQRDDAIALTVLITDYIHMNYKCQCPACLPKYSIASLAYYEDLSSSWRSNVIAHVESAYDTTSHSFKFIGSKHDGFYDSCLGIILFNGWLFKSPIHWSSPFEDDD